MLLILSDFSKQNTFYYYLKRQLYLFQGTTPQAEALARGISHKLRELIRLVGDGITNVETSSIQQPAHTLCGRIEQARAFLSNPGFDDNGLGINDVILLYNLNFFKH